MLNSMLGKLVEITTGEHKGRKGQLRLMNGSPVVVMHDVVLHGITEKNVKQVTRK